MKAKYTLEQKLAAVEYYKSGGSGLRATAELFGVGFSSLRGWVKAYEHHGEVALSKVGRRRFSSAFKLKVVRHMQIEQLSSRQVAALYNIPRLDAAGK